MRALYRAYRDRPDVVPPVVAHVLWGRTIALLGRLNDPAAREWYARAAIQPAAARRR